MVFIVYSLKDPISTRAAAALKEFVPFEPTGEINGLKHFKYENIDLIEIPDLHLHAEHLDNVGADLIIFLSRHGSAKEVPCFTVHPEGNWSDSAILGGKPKQLSTAAPEAMQKILIAMKKHNKTTTPVTYEATHHGPLLKTPSLYAEVGGNDETRADPKNTEFLARAVFESLFTESSHGKIAFGIGGLHYSDRFAKLAISDKYAFGHIVSKHYVSNTDMFEQAIERCSPRAEIAVIDWKSMTGPEREQSIKKLNELGLDYEKI